jgi:hypothetical protein
MYFLRLASAIKAGIFTLFLLGAVTAFSQQADTTRGVLQFSGAVSITNNGFSLIPAFSLGKPAVMATLYAGGKRLSFEPEFRYSLEGKPWSFIFIWRYKVIKKDKFQFTLGTHLPALNFISANVPANGTDQEVIKARRFFPVVELFPSHRISRDINIGLYYQYAYGQEEELARHTQFISLRTSLANLRVAGPYHLKINPQLYYLKMDKRDGYYVTSSLSLARNRFPLSVSTAMNKALQTDIAGKKSDWNVSLVYSFNTSYGRL